jgi:hypothetical protein
LLNPQYGVHIITSSIKANTSGRESVYLPMLSKLEKSAEVQKATQSFIKTIKRAARKLPVNHAQLPGDLSLFVSGLWDKLESEITGQFKGQ